MSRSWRSRVGAVAVAIAGLGVFAGQAAAQLPPQEPGVTLRTFQMASAPSEICTIKSGSTPNVDKLMPVINWTLESEFGASNNFISHVIANINIAIAGEYTFRLTSDDGSELFIDGELLIDNDGLHGEESKDGTITLSAGYHALRINYFEAGGGQILRLHWKVPGSNDFVIVPNSVLSTEADVVRVTAPGNKFCEGDTDTPGDGLRLDSVNPNYDLTNLRPPGFEPHVSGMDFLPDGRMVITTAGDVSAGGWVPNPESGEVFLLSHVTGTTSSSQVTYTKIAGNLRNPMGIQVVDGRYFVAERDQLTELVPDTNGDGLMEHVQRATWPNGGNFHEFAFGLIHDDDYFYIARSVAINNGGATTNPQPGVNAGTAIKIDRETWEVSLIAGGLRTPNGINFGPEGGIFVNDNQGAWLPASKMVHIKPGRFFNHYMNPPGPFDDQPVTQPVLWMPQNEIANSPSNPVQIKEGPFAGQMLWGDVTYGGLQRGFLEKVDGEYQGAVFRHSAGLEAGVNRTMIGPDGAIYVGGIGEGGNWGEDGKLRYGLQKLTPNGKNVFDMATMEVIEGGFKVTYTQPISEETAAGIKDAYRIRQWRYVPTQQYGGPKIDEEGLLVTDATVSADRKTVTLQIDGLKPGRVVHLRSPRPFNSADGEELWNTEAWYTLNSLPGYEAPAESGYYEAEEAQLHGSAGIDTEHSGFSGSGFVDGIENVGAGVTFTATVDEAGTYPVHLRYANGPNPFSGPKTMALYVNGERQSNWTLPITSPSDWKAWAFVTRDLPLKAGANQITLRYETGTDGHVNLDALKVGEGQDICAPAEVEPGYTGLFDGTLESLTKWRLAGPGSWGRQADCSIRGEGGMGLLWYTQQEFGDYSLKLDWKLVKDDNSGVFVGFPNPGNDPWVAVDRGYEIQIDESDEIDRLTGSIYTFQSADRAKVLEVLKPHGQWNSYEIQVQGQNIKVFLNGALVNDFNSTDPARDLSSGFIGVQNHGAGESVWYRNIRIKAGAVDPPAGPVVTLPGSFNSELGCPGDWQPECPAVEMSDPDRDGVYEFTTDAIPPGNWEFKVAHDRSWAENYGAGGVRDGANIPLTVAAGQRVTFKYSLATHLVEVTVATTSVEEETEVGADVQATLALQLGAPASFGSFVPGVTRDYSAATVASVTSTGVDATLSVSDPSATATGRLVNGSYALAQPLQVKAGDGAFAALGGAPATLLTFPDPVSGASVPIDFKQSIGAEEPLRTGAYGKTVTFTLSTNTP